MNRRIAGLSITLTLGLLVAGGLGLVLAGSGAAQGPDGYAVYYVAPSCAGMPTPCYAEVQSAVDGVDDPGDVVQIAQGTYTAVHVRDGTTQAVHVTKTVTLRGGYAPDFSAWDPDLYPTVLDAQSLGRVIYAAGDASVAIEGLTLTGGDSTAGGGLGYGGGLWAVGGSGPSLTVTLRHSQIISNVAAAGAAGGGLAAVFSNVVIEDSLVQNNQAQGTGGGARFEQANVDLTNTIWRDNETASNGGGFYALNYSNVEMTNTVLIDNHAGTAGGALVSAAAYVVGRHTTVARNTAGDGTGIYVTSGSLPGSGPGSVSLTNSILAFHDIGIYAYGSLPYLNTARLDHTLWDGHDVLAAGGGTLNVSNTVVGSPDFCCDGYHIYPTSAAIDQGVAAGVRFDIDGQLRPSPGGYDLGADEITEPVWLPLILRNGP